MTSGAIIGSVIASIVPFEPFTTVIAIVAGLMMTIATLFLGFIALAPSVSEKWGQRLNVTSTHDHLEANEAD